MAACRVAIRREMSRRFDELFSKLDDALCDLADKSESNDHHTGYIGAIQVFRRRRDEIFSLFLQRLLEESESGPGAGTDSRSTAGKGDPPERSSMEQADLEEGLAVTNLISKAENRYRSELSVLRRHLAGLRGQKDIDSRSDPLGPYRHCNAFRTAMSLVENVELPIKLIVYKFFDKQVMDQLGGLYARCLDFTGRQHSTAVDSSERSVSRAPDGREQERARRSQADAGVPEGHDSCVPVPEQNPAVGFSDLQRLLGRRRRADAGSGGLGIVDTGELMSVLTRLQELTGSESAAGELRPRLMAELHRGREDARLRALDPVDEDTLDLVFLLFEHVSQRNDIPDALKVLIGRLQIPFLKVALLDKSVFADKHHPARRLLNHLADVTVGWGGGGNRTPEELYGRVRWVVDQVLERYQTDLAVLSELDAELCGLLAREQEEAQSREAKVQQDLELRERQHDARRLMRDVIADRLRGRGPVPDAVSSLLYEGWQQVLLAVYTRDGATGAEWHAAIRTIDRLVWSVQPKVESEDRRELLRSIPELLRTLRESLAQVSYDQRRLARWFRELQALHIAALRRTSAVSRQEGYRARRPDASDDTPLSSDMAGAVVSADFARLDTPEPAAPGLERGAWIEVRRDDGDPVRVKLAWRSPQSGINLFVDARGRKALELTEKDMMTLRQQGTLTVLADVPIVDRAMEQVVHKLKGGQEA